MDDVSPCFKAFMLDLALPSGVFGPVDLRAFARLAFLCFLDDISILPSVEHLADMAGPIPTLRSNHSINGVFLKSSFPWKAKILCQIENSRVNPKCWIPQNTTSIPQNTTLLAKIYRIIPQWIFAVFQKFFGHFEQVLRNRANR